MPNHRQFWRIVGLIGVAHVAVVIGLLRWNSGSKTSGPATVVWVTGDAEQGSSNRGYGGLPAATSARESESDATPAPTPATSPDNNESVVLPSAKSEIELPSPTVTPTPAAKPVPSPVFKGIPKPTPKPSRKPRPRPTSTPKPTPKPTAKPKPKTTVLAKASPKPTPNASPDDSEEDRQKEEESRKSVEDRTDAGDNRTPSDGPDAGGSGATNGHGSGGTKSSELAAYSRMLHDRLYSEWIQPTSSVALATKISTLVRVRIEKDGRVSHFEIIRSSGNVMIDESVSAIGKKVTQVDPPPASLRSGGRYDVKINFELNSD